MNAIENLIESMIKNNIYCKVLNFNDNAKIELFLTDIRPYIENRTVRIKIYDTYIKFYLGFESMKRLMAYGHKKCMN